MNTLIHLQTMKKIWLAHVTDIKNYTANCCKNVTDMKKNIQLEIKTFKI